MSGRRGKGDGGNKDHTKLENSDHKPARKLCSNLQRAIGSSRLERMSTVLGSKCGGDGTCLQWASGRWVAVSSRLFECANTRSATGRAARAAQCPPAARSLLAKKMCGRGASGNVGRRSRIFRRPMIARPPTRRAPAPAFCSRNPPTSLAHPPPVQCPPSYSRARCAKGRGSCVLRPGLVAGHGHASGGAPLHG